MRLPGPVPVPSLHALHAHRISLTHGTGMASNPLERSARSLRTNARTIAEWARQARARQASSLKLRDRNTADSTSSAIPADIAVTKTNRRA